MTAQHTPGPWQLDELGIIYSGDCTELCARHSNDHVVAIVTDARPEDRRLIAAAPAMLAALEGIARDAEDSLGDLAASLQEGAAYNDTWKALNAKWCAVLDAIDQARGRAPLTSRVNDNREDA